MLERMRETEFESYQALKNAIARSQSETVSEVARQTALSSIQVLRKIYSSAAQSCLAFESKVMKMRAAQGAMVSLDFAKQVVVRHLGPFDSMLRNFAKTVGPRANPQNPALAEKEIQEAINKLLAQREKALDTAT
jgi:hypothetical protein